MAPDSDGKQGEGTSGHSPSHAIDLLPVPCALLAADGRVQAVNDAWRAGIGEASLLAPVGASFLEAIERLTASRRAVEGMSGVLGGAGKRFAYDIASTGNAGSRWFRVLAGGLAGGGASVALVDITDHHRDEESLRESEERFRRLVTGVRGFAIVTLDERGRIQSWNRGAERMTGFEEAEVSGRHWASLLPEAERSEELRGGLLVRAGDQEHAEEERWLTRRDLSRFLAHVGLTALRDDHGGLRGYALVVRELHEDEAAEAEPGDIQAQLMTIVHSAMDASITIDESHRVVLFNKAAERIFGVPSGEAIGSSIERFLPERFRGAHAQHVRTFAATGSTMRAMGRLGALSGLRADGTEFPIEASISQAIAGGRKLMTVILRDVTERKKLEAQLLQSQKMEGIGRLAAGVAHDFNNLLMAMMNYLTLAGRQLEAAHPAQGAIGHAREAADRAAALTRQLLAFARKQSVMPRVLSPRDVVTGLEPMLRRLMSEDVGLRMVLDPDTWNVKADANQLEQVLVNVSVNARDAMPGGGTLTIETGNVVLGEAYCRTRVGATPGEHVLIAVTDTGVGMTPEILSNLFEPFFTTKPPGQGTGLGLATCHGIIHQSGGHIAVYSEPNRGTTIKIFLPRATGVGEVRVEKPLAAPVAGGNETLLLAEDSPMVRELIADALRAAGYTVIAASTGEEAIRMAEANAKPIALLVTDVVMPGMSGVKLAELLRASGRVTRVIYMSGYTEATISPQGVEPARAVFLSKPFSTDVLLQKVREVLDAADS